jgi:hypothetical protein
LEKVNHFQTKLGVKWQDRTESKEQEQNAMALMAVQVSRMGFAKGSAKGRMQN